MEELLKLLIERHLTLGSVESLTGGLFASTVTSIPGASATFRGALVTYSSEVKSDVCNVPSELIAEKGVVSYEVAESMALNGAKVLKCDVVVSFTGNAGPSCLDGLPAGRIYVGIYILGEVTSYEFTISNKSRNEVRQTIVDEAIKLLLTKIKDIPNSSRIL